MQRMAGSDDCGTWLHPALEESSWEVTRLPEESAMVHCFGMGHLATVAREKWMARRKLEAMPSRPAGANPLCSPARSWTAAPTAAGYG